MSEEEAPELGLALQNHFRAIDVRLGKLRHSKHRQSLVTLSRRHSMVQSFDDTEFDGPLPVRRISVSSSDHLLHNHFLNSHHHPVTRSLDATYGKPRVI